VIALGRFRKAYHGADDMKMGSVVIRVDANSTIGIGHLRRCVTLAAEIRRHGYDVLFICRDRFGPELISLVAPNEIRWIGDAGQDIDLGNPISDEYRDADATLRIMRRLASLGSWCVIDSYNQACRWEKRVAEAGHRILAIDDLRTRKHHADLLVSDAQKPFNPALNERAGARSLVGWKYALLDSIYTYSGPSSRKWSRPPRLLISYGGADVTGETIKAAEAIRALKMDDRLQSLIGQVDFVVGIGNSKVGNIERMVEGLRGVAVHRVVPSLFPLMSEADLVLTAGGQTMVESLALRKPCIVTLTSEHQALMTGELAAQHAIFLLGADAAVGPENVRMMVIQVLTDFTTIAARMTSGTLFDHRGASRIVAAMLRTPVRLQ
jgi:UDP-2,4-diacetamido-2,4,6-trideoxy-beta-L-altropyranose hydrolase